MKNRLDKIKIVQLMLNKILNINKELLEFISKEEDNKFREDLLKFAKMYHETNGVFIDYLMFKLPEFMNKDIIDLEFKKIMEDFKNE